jgi:transmembrane sensor
MDEPEDDPMVRPAVVDSQSVYEQAATWFLRCRAGPLTPEESEALEGWLSASPENAAAWRDTQATWRSFSDNATLPELVTARRQALAAVRGSKSGRWSRLLVNRAYLAAGFVILALVALWWVIPYGGNLYTTGVGEQHAVLLRDNSRIILDALTRVRVVYGSRARTVELLEGQAQFEVAHKPDWPFLVRAGGRVIAAHGTVFTVEYLYRRVRVALLEGSVTVSDAAQSVAAAELKPGQVLRIEANGKQSLGSPDFLAATAWRQGKVVFRQEPLIDAVRRLNRYSRIQLRVADPSIEEWPVDGIFGVADAETFADAIAGYFPIQVRKADPTLIELRRRP